MNKSLIRTGGFCRYESENLSPEKGKIVRAAAVKEYFTKLLQQEN